MSWSPIHPEAAPGKHAIAPVTIVLSRAEGRFRQKITLTVRPALLESGASWCVPGAALGIERGSAEHAGMLRLSPGGEWRFRKPSARIMAATVVLPPPPGCPPEGCERLAVACRVVGQALEITLPDWGARKAANGRLPRTPYVGISERVPDPAMAIQQLNGGRVR